MSNRGFSVHSANSSSVSSVSPQCSLNASTVIATTAGMSSVRTGRIA